MRKIVFLWIALIAVAMNVFADGKVSITASTPDAVAARDQLRLSYTVTTQKVRDFRAPSMKEFDVLMGPSRSQQSSAAFVAIIGATMDLGLLWDIADTFNGLMIIPNLIAVFMLSGTCLLYTSMMSWKIILRMTHIR